MHYQILSPFTQQIHGDSLAEAIKMFVKVNNANQFKNFVIADQMNKYNTQIKYYKENNKNKIGISINKINDIGYTVYPQDNYLQPIYQERSNGLPPKIVSMGASLNPYINYSRCINCSNTNCTCNKSNYTCNKTICTCNKTNCICNKSNISPIITAPGMISTTANGIVMNPYNLYNPYNI